MLPWSAPSFSVVKGIIHAPSLAPAIKPGAREATMLFVLLCRGAGDISLDGMLWRYFQDAKERNLFHGAPPLEPSVNERFARWDNIVVDLNQFSKRRKAGQPSSPWGADCSNLTMRVFDRARPENQPDAK
jgi:hypothetical protein